MKRRILSFVCVAASILLMLYPWISNWLQERQSGSQIEVYKEQADSMDDSSLAVMVKDAAAYNKALAESKVVLSDPFIFEKMSKIPGSYNSLLDMDGHGLMGFVEVPSIHINLPIYHGTSQEVLRRGAGHLEGTSLPVGGEGTHTVLTGHTGLNSAKLFTDLTAMEKGDLFFIRCAGQDLCYRVSRIQVVKPDAVKSLQSVPGKDLATLITCTPYGVNSHRLFVTGERTEYNEEARAQAREQDGRDTNSQWMRTYRNGVMAGTCISICIIVYYRRKKSRAMGTGKGDMAC